MEPVSDHIEKEFEFGGGDKRADLGETGDVIPISNLVWDGGNKISCIVRYELRGWVVDKCEICVSLACLPDEEPVVAEDLWELPWEDFDIFPTKKTKILEKGDPEALKDLEDLI